MGEGYGEWQGLSVWLVALQYSLTKTPTTEWYYPLPEHCKAIGGSIPGKQLKPSPMIRRTEQESNRGYEFQQQGHTTVFSRAVLWYDWNLV